jgi:arylsulfatase
MKHFIYILIIITIFSCGIDSNKNTNLDLLPNIVLIYTDDQGYGDLSSYGSMSINTPNIDALAKNGAKLTSFLNASSTCSPSRAALLTGSYPIRTGVTNVLWPRSGGMWGGGNSKTLKGLNPNEITIAEVLRDVGYSTAMSGKWHLGDELPFLPTQQGFDTYFGIPYSNDMNVKNLPVLLDNEIIEKVPDQSLLTQRYTDFAIDFINDLDDDKPFFIYLAHTMPHIPIYASEDFQGTSKGSVYGDVIEEIDFNVGRLVNLLKEKDIYDNTIFIYTSDNGPWLNYGNHAGTSGELRGGKFDVFEGGYRVPCVISWPNVIKRGIEIDQLISTIDIMPTICSITGAELPKNKIDGINVLDALKNNNMADLDDRFFYYHKEEKLYGVRQGKWKYLAPSTYNEILFPGEDGKHGVSTWQKDFPEALFNLDSDVRELNNRLSDYPEIASILKNQLLLFQEELDNESRPIGEIDRE